jgi:hypothetical protein
MNCKEANAIPIDLFLSGLGVEPVKVRSSSKWYLSPLRTEKTASFKVDSTMNRWYDYGLAQGGNLVDLGTRLNGCSVADFLEQMGKNKFTFEIAPKENIQATSEWNILKVKPISHPALTNYLKDRGIFLRVANTFCSEVHYSNGRHRFFAIGFSNDSGGYEIRNSLFKGCLGVKDITTLNNSDPSRLVLFEGFMDFLSARQVYDNLAKSSSIILNSVTQLPKAIQRIDQLNPYRLESYFNNDDAGKRCTQSLKEKCPGALDRSPSFHPYKDINDFLKSKTALNQSM